MKNGEDEKTLRELRGVRSERVDEANNDNILTVAFAVQGVFFSSFLPLTLIEIMPTILPVSLSESCV